MYKLKNADGVEIGNSLTLPFIAKTSDFAITTKDDYFIAADGTSGTVTITLPTAVGIQGTIYVIKAIDITNAVDVDTTSSQTIDDELTYDFNIKNECITVISDNANWLIM